jgi:hypothetical protein
MRALIQRTSEAKVTVDGRIIGEIGEGLVVFVCAMLGDVGGESEWLARKTVNLRIFRDDGGPTEIACRDAGGLLLNELALDKLQALRDRLGRGRINLATTRIGRLRGFAQRPGVMQGVPAEHRLRSGAAPRFTASSRR